MSHSNEAIIAINTAEDIRRMRADVLDSIAGRLRIRLIEMAMITDVGIKKPRYMSRNNAVSATQGNMSAKVFAALTDESVRLNYHEARALVQCCLGLVNDMRTLGLA